MYQQLLNQVIYMVHFDETKREFSRVRGALCLH
jgi:hypothetical protein